MPAVRIEADAFGDPRIEYLAKLAGYSHYEALGRLAHLWRYCTLRQLYSAPCAVVTAMINAPAETLVQAGLGEHDADDSIRIRGTEGRIEWLAKLRANSKAGGEATRDKWKLENRPDGLARGLVLLGQTPGQTEAKARPELGPPTLSLTLINSDQTPKVPKRPGRPRKPTLGEPTDSELESARVVLAKLGAKNGVTYTCSKAHVALIVGRLRDGYSEMDLRKVIAYCAEQWSGNEKMAGYLRPETLFGPTTITRYADAARAWFASLPVNEERAG